MAKEKVLITGVAGFIGSNLAERILKEGYEVIGLDNLAYGVKEQIPEEIEFKNADIRSKDIYPLFKDVDYVFHLAAKNCISDCQEDPVETADINVKGTVNVFEAAKRAGVKKVIYAESSAVYEGSNVFPTPESEVKPESFYALSKAASNLFADGYKRFSGLNLVGLRYFNVYGPRQDYRRTIPPAMSAFIINLLRGKPPTIYGSGEKRRDFVHVDDVNDFHLLCLKDNRVDGEIFNLGSGKNYSVLEIYRMIKEMLGSSLDPVFRPDLPGEAQVTLADITKAKELGWWPKIDIKTGISSMIDYIKKEVEKGNIK